MKSIKESVHQLLEDQIGRLGLQAYYEVQKAEIIGRRTQTSFTFTEGIFGEALPFPAF